LRKTILAAFTAILLLAGFAGASTAFADPGPNGNNDHGLCTAYFNGQKNGHGEGEDQSNQPPPFQGLEEDARAYTDSDKEEDPGTGSDNDKDGQSDEGGEAAQLTAAENIFNYCNDLSTIGGNPTHGRFTCDDDGNTVDGLDDDSDTRPECETNPEPGNS
jgi:hypothetical protein